MNSKFLSIVTCALLCLFPGGVAASVNIVPRPFHVIEQKGYLTLDTQIRVFAQGQELESLARVWRESLHKSGVPGAYVTENGFQRIVSDAVLPEVVLSAKERNAQLHLSLDKQVASEEYALEISAAGIAIRGGSADGVWWGLQTLTQLIIRCANEQPGYKMLRLPHMQISDKPKFSYRGAMLDCCRHFFSVEQVKKFIDMMALHKLNTFHWHLTDDQGWRIEIKKYPLLTQIGSVRDQTLIGHIQKSKVYDGKPYGGYYTQEQIREVVAYATARRITIIPEIEMPGHAQAALTAYPYLGCKGEGYQVRQTWGISKDVVCLGKDTTYEFFRDVLDEVVELFPGRIVHIGGDEAKADNWKECPMCQAKLKELGLDSERQLQGHLVAQIEKYLQTKGKVILGWDEILTAGVTSSAMVMSWRGPAGGIKAASMGNDVVMAPNTYFYLDYYQTTDPVANKEPLAIGGCVPMDKCYSFEPFDQLDQNTKQHIKGIQANLWTEYIDSFDKVQYKLLPRLAAMSEVAWSETKDHYDAFISRVRYGMLPVYQYFGLIYAPYAFNRANFDEDKINPYTLPDVLKTEDGRKISTVKQWEKTRRPEVLALFEQEMYGTLPGQDVDVTAKCLEQSDTALDGKAMRRQIELTFRRNGVERKALVLIYLPNGVKGAAPCFLGFNFQGNNTVSSDPAVITSQYSEYLIGNRSPRWNVERIIDAGYALVTAHYYDFFYDKEDEDFEGKYPKSMLALFGKNSSADFAPNEGRAISTWAWGYSRVLDYLIGSEKRIDPSRVAVMGHSRLGKTALWAGANDPRFALVISNNSGSCGSALAKRRIGEDFHRILRFKHWFCRGFDKYVDNEEALGFDQHQLLALIAPRPLYIACAVEDVWSDPKGAFLASVEASRVYELYGHKGIAGCQMPSLGTPLNDGRVGYHIREGKHDVKPFDWELFIAFADKHLK